MIFATGIHHVKPILYSNRKQLVLRVLVHTIVINHNHLS